MIRFIGNVTVDAGISVDRRRQRAHIGNQRFGIVLPEHAEVLVGHHREQRPAVARHAVGHRAQQFAVGPGADRGGRDVGRVQGRDGSRNVMPPWPSRLGICGRGVSRPVTLAMAVGAPDHVMTQVPAAGHLLRRAGHLQRTGRREARIRGHDVGPASPGHDREHQHRHRDDLDEPARTRRFMA